MTAPIKEVHVDGGSIGELHYEDLVPGTERIVFGSIFRAKRMETIENQSDPWVICTANDFPSITMIEDMAAPGKRFKADAYIEAFSNLPSS